jgi:hypothetical protein
LLLLLPPRMESEGGELAFIPAADVIVGAAVAAGIYKPQLLQPAEDAP